MSTARQARRRYLPERQITAHPAPKHYHRLSDDERAFVVRRIQDGLTDIEVARMFFRKFGTDYSATGVSYIRKALEG